MGKINLNKLKDSNEIKKMFEMHEKTCPKCNSALNARDWKNFDKGGFGLGTNLYQIFYISCVRCGWQKRVGEKWSQK